MLFDSFCSGGRVLKVSIFEQSRLKSDLLTVAIEQSGHLVVDVFAEVTDLHFGANPDLLIVCLPDDQEACQALRQLLAQSDTPVLAICSSDSVGRVRDYLGDSVKAVHPDSHSLELLLSSLTLLENGYSVSFVPGEIAPVGSVPPRQPQVLGTGVRAANDPSLSSRELHVLAKIREGYSNKEIANQLNISDSTVKVHVRSILRKANVKNRTQAALWAEDYLKENWLT